MSTALKKQETEMSQSMSVPINVSARGRNDKLNEKLVEGLRVLGKRIDAYQAAQGSSEPMPMDEIVAEVKLARAERRARQNDANHY